jgi:hypothetical protein
MGILSGNPKLEPMHYGEVFDVWSYLQAQYSGIVAYQTFYNHTGDGDLREFIQDKIEQMKQDIGELETLLKENGVALPPAPPERPKADLESIPPGARFNDNEIGAALAVDNAAALVACSKIMGTSIREDIGALFGKMHTKCAAMGLRLLRINKEKGWLVPPPLHVSKQEG